ncbi:hypothetical protein T08_1297 [Trichinella sp. T8]|nr:hypothetical protein T08_1297 [Trichinella sp. T8]
MEDVETSPELDNLLAGLAEFQSGSSGPWIREAFQSALENLQQKLGLAKFIACLHRRWLTDSRVVWPAVMLCNVIAYERGDEVNSATTILFGIMMNDFKNRFELRKISRGIFANSARFMIDYFFSNYHRRFTTFPRPADAQQNRQDKIRDLNKDTTFFYTMDSANSMTSANERIKREMNNIQLCHSLAITDNDEYDLPTDPLLEDLVEPIFDYLHLLVDETAARPEIFLFHHAIMNIGKQLERLHPGRMHKLTIQLRHCLVEHAAHPQDRALMLELVELISHRWHYNQIPSDVQNFYNDFKSHTNKFTEPYTKFQK